MKADMQVQFFIKTPVSTYNMVKSLVIWPQPGS